jgi:hypothetical protein
LCSARYFFTTNDRCAGALSFRRNQLCLAHHENARATRKPAFSSLPPYDTLLQTFVISLKEIFIAKRRVLFSHVVP